MRVRSKGAFTWIVVGALLAAPASRSIDVYIAQTWSVLTRSNRDLAKSAVDPKFPPPSGGRWPVYIPKTENVDRIAKELKHEMARGSFSAIDLQILPADTSHLSQQGLLYLPRPYVVPGGRFNEMYGWDSYFISVGLLRDHKTTLARDMTDNFLYEIVSYGRILNANRTYYLTRSQPPFLTEMLLDLYHVANDRRWLERALPALTSYYQFWTTEPHLTPETGLSRYYDFGEGPAPEVVASERDAQGRTHYDLVREYLRDHDLSDYNVSEYYDREHDRLTPAAYKGDRSMRESGFDPSNRFGPFGLNVIHYNPVCLNSLLYLMETQGAEIARILGHPQDEKLWLERAASRAERINRFMWDEHDGLYYDYDFVRRERRRYPFLSTYYPLWVSLAAKDQAVKLEHNLGLFEQPGGLQTSTSETGNQWDAPFGWAPLQMITAEGLRRYGYDADADRISRKFLTLVEQEYRRTGTIVEKYDVVHPGAEATRSLRFGYRSNEVGFGWTNAVYTRLEDEMSHAVGGHTGKSVGK